MLQIEPLPIDINIYSNHLHQTILITGASQGLGLELACLLASKGANIAIVARSIPKLEKELERVKAKAVSKLQRFQYFSKDVSTAKANQELLAQVMEWNDGNPPDIVWACAGVSKPGLFVETDVQTLEDQMQINYWSAAYLLHSTLQAWLKPVLDANWREPSSVSATEPLSENSRHFIFTSSTLAYWGIAGYSPYSPCKAALRSLCDSMRQELLLYEGAAKAQNIKDFRPVRLHLVTPGNILTEGYKTENLLKHPVTKKLEEGDEAQLPEIIARDAVSKLEQGDYLVTTNLLGRLMKSAALGGSKRNGLGVLDFLCSCVTSLATLYIGPDMDRTVYKWGEANGIGGEGEPFKPALSQTAS